MVNMYALKISNLSDAIVKNELMCRKINIEGSNISSRKQQLKTILEYEHSMSTKPVISPCLAIGDDLSDCSDILNYLKDEFDKKGNTVLESLSDRTEFLEIRLRRIVITTSTEPIHADKWAVLRRETDDFLKMLSHQTTSDLEFPNFENRLAQLNLQDTPSGNSTTNNEFVNRNQHNTINKLKVPVYKWRIKFSGDKNSFGKVIPSAPDFLRDVNALSRSRNVSFDELFLSASEIFEGTAAKWLRASIANGHITNWQQLQNKLIYDFEGVDYWDDLYDSIKARVQKPSESVIEYVSVMEDNFSKLDTITVAEKLRILRKNILPIYAKQLAVYKYTSVQALMDDCKAIESIENKSKERFRRDPSPGPSNPNRNWNPNRINSISDNSSNRQVRFHSPYHNHNDFSENQGNAPYQNFTRPNFNRNSQQFNRNPSPNRLDRNRPASAPQQNYFCSICNRPGHTRNFCNQRSGNTGGTDSAGSTSVQPESGPSSNNNN